MNKVWMVRAGRAAIYASEFISRRMTAIGYGKIESLEDVHTREQISALVSAAFTDYNRLQIANATGQTYRFREELVEGSTVLMYEPADRLYRGGTVTGPYVYNALADEELRHTKTVRWDKMVSRDVLTPQTKNSLGRIATIFCISEDAAEEIEDRFADDVRPDVVDVLSEAPPSTGIEAIAAESNIRRDIEQKALEFLQDRIVRLEWDEMRELVARLLRAMGYKTQVSAPGADRARDIIASPDGFGFKEPRILVEVKHRKGTIGAPDIHAS